MILKKLENKKILCIVDSDLDGTGCRVVAEYLLKDIVQKLDIVQTGLNDITEDTKNIDYNNYDFVLFADLVPTPEIYVQIKSLNKGVFVFDHHLTSYETMNNVIERDEYFYDISKSGTKIFYDALTKNIRKSKVVSEFIDLVDTYDLWNDESDLWEDALNLQRVIWKYVDWFVQKNLTWYENHSDFVHFQLKKFKESNKFFFLARELRFIADTIKQESVQYELAKKNLTIRQDELGMTYGYTKVRSKVSIVGYYLLKKYPDIKYIVLYCTFTKKDGYKYSIRSREKDDITVSAIAEKWGGGGHFNASGFIIPLDDEGLQKALALGKIHLQ